MYIVPGAVETRDFNEYRDLYRDNPVAEGMTSITCSMHDHSTFCQNFSVNFSTLNQTVLEKCAVSSSCIFNQTLQCACRFPHMFVVIAVCSARFPHMHDVIAVWGTHFLHMHVVIAVCSDLLFSFRCDLLD